MILTEIKQYMMKNRAVSLTDLSVRFNVEPDAMRGMLDQWIKKGRIIKLPEGSRCPNCCAGCDSGYMEIYEWKED
ncbi:MAG: FeoC-like transcriptional regulator [Deltaproteobacteria bacterium]|nr:FeoC-like transcriptional regulator [Deltaproteobacteria bacterium]